jgi:hypothetical protein
MKRLDQVFCKHDYKMLRKSRHSQFVLRHCRKCGLFEVGHVGLGIYWTTKSPDAWQWCNANSYLTIGRGWKQ